MRYLLTSADPCVGSCQARVGPSFIVCGNAGTTRTAASIPLVAPIALRPAPTLPAHFDDYELNLPATLSSVSPASLSHAAPASAPRLTASEIEALARQLHADVAADRLRAMDEEEDEEEDEEDDDDDEDDDAEEDEDDDAPSPGSSFEAHWIPRALGLSWRSGLVKSLVDPTARKFYVALDVAAYGAELQRGCGWATPLEADEE